MCASVVLLVRYGELALKSAYVRRQLEDRLAANVRDMFAASSVECVVKVERGRLFVHADDEASALRLLRRVFGIVSVSAARETTSELEGLTRDAVAYARDVLRPGTTFAIRPRRSGQHPYTSQQLAVRLGRAIQDAIEGLTVDLETPDREFHVEVRGRRAYLFHAVVDGPGGLPLGSQGEVLAAVEDESEVVATWLVMRRGCRARVAGSSAFLAVLRRWDPRLEALEMQPADLTTLAAAKGIPLVASAKHLDQGQAIGVLVLRPLVGLADEEVRRLAAEIAAA